MTAHYCPEQFIILAILFALQLLYLNFVHQGQKFGYISYIIFKNAIIAFTSSVYIMPVILKM